MTDAGLLKAVVVGGAWAFAVATVLAPRVAGWFMLISFAAAVVVSFVAL